MSQLITDFIIEPVVRQARRFSSRRYSTTAGTLTSSSRTTSSTTTTSHPITQQTGFPEYVDPIYEPRADVQQAEHDTDAAILDALTERIRTIPRLESIRTEAVVDDEVVGSRDRAETDPEPLNRQQRPQVFLRERFVSANASFPTTTVNETGLRLMEDSTMSTRSSTTRTSDGPPIADTRLPEDDGMRHMRRRILAIHGSDLPSDEKSRLVHQIMLEQYMSNGNGALRGQSPSSIHSNERPTTPTSGTSDLVRIDSPGTSASLGLDELVVTAKDAKPTFWVPPPPPKDATPEQSRGNSIEEDRPFGCEHYKRNVKLQCSVCLKWYTCRFCHDKVEDHHLNRQATKNMLCMHCGTAQAAAGYCARCGFCAAYYYCKLCKLWDDDSTKAIYHCDSCGICRRGEGLGKDFFHCQKCSTCISIRIMDTHKCIERSMDCDCPICGEYMFTSPKTVIFMRCGHTIHYDCWAEHMKNSYKCPICSKSMINMEMTFRQFDRDIELQPMPAKFQETRAWIFCNDCENKSLVPFHWVGLKCISCDSYNTIRLDTISAPEDVDLGAPEIDLGLHRPSPVSQEVIPEVHTGAVAIANRNPVETGPSICESHNTTTSDQEDVDMPDEEDDVDFWGGTSPRYRMDLEERLHSGVVDDDSTDDELDLMDEDDPEGDEEDDPLALFGHR